MEKNNENLNTRSIRNNIKRQLIKCISWELAIISLMNELNSQILKTTSEHEETYAIEEIIPEEQLTKRHARFLDMDKLSIDSIGEMRDFLEANSLEYTDLLNYAESSPKYKEKYLRLLSRVFNSSDRLIAALKGDNFGLNTLYIGDSRTQGLLINGTITEEQTVYGVGYGYDWFIGQGQFSPKKTNALEGAIPGIKSKMEEYKSYNIAIWLGVNDLNYISAKTYFAKFAELAESEWKNHEIFIVSVAPVHDSRSEYIKNSKITKFNENMKTLAEECGLPNIHFVDLEFTQSSIANYDWAGLHYGRGDCVNIQNIIQTYIDTYTLDTEASIIEFFEEVVVDVDESMHFISSKGSQSKVLEKRSC